MKPSARSPLWPRPSRWWTYGRDEWDGPLVRRGDDEWGRLTVAIRLPGHRGLVIPYRWCNDPECEGCRDRCPTTGRLHWAWVGGKVWCEECDPAGLNRPCWYCAEPLGVARTPRWVMIQGTPRPVHHPDCRPDRATIRGWAYVRRNDDKPHRCPSCHRIAPWRMGVTTHRILGVHWPLRMWCAHCRIRWWYGKPGDWLGLDIEGWS